MTKEELSKKLMKIAEQCPDAYSPYISYGEHRDKCFNLDGLFTFDMLKELVALETIVED